MLGITVAEVVLDGLRTYQLAHTAQRIDVTLSSLLFRHLLALPLAWFKERQAGVTVARVHELKTVREFLTGSALTLCTDLLFMVLFFVVMALYSIPLTLIVIISLVFTPFYRRLSRHLCAVVSTISFARERRIRLFWWRASRRSNR
jgi:subfamily B ATP-binding cassette protein HlyB/CyaB